jgi:hypothetical protein
VFLRFVGEMYQEVKVALSRFTALASPVRKRNWE